jgi:hypothetical protein
MLVKREALEDVGLWDVGYFLHCEDLDWCMRFRLNNWLVMFVPERGLSTFGELVVEADRFLWNGISITECCASTASSSRNNIPVLFGGWWSLASGCALVWCPPTSLRGWQQLDKRMTTEKLRQ